MPRNKSIYKDWSEGRTAENVAFNPCDVQFIQHLQAIQSIFKDVEVVIRLVQVNDVVADPKNDVASHKNTGGLENDVVGKQGIEQDMADWQKHKNTIQEICDLNIALLLQETVSSQNDKKTDKDESGNKRPYPWLSDGQQINLSGLLVELKMLGNGQVYKISCDCYTPPINVTLIHN